MILRFEQLANHLEHKLLPLYFIHGEEPLQAGEAGDMVRATARQQGFDERVVIEHDDKFNWNKLPAIASEMSLFATRRLLELRLPSGKPGVEGAKVLIAYAATPPPDTILLITSGKLDSSRRESKWFKALGKAGATVAIWPVDRANLPRWIQQRMAARGLSCTPEAAELLADRVEGNMLAAAQDVEKLLLLHGSGRIEAAQIQEAVANSARYNLFELVDVALLGNVPRLVRMLDGLRTEGISPTLISWALEREVRTLLGMATATAQGNHPDQVMRQARVWDKRKGAVSAALHRHPPGSWQKILTRAANLDRIVKGATRGNPWDELLQLGLAIAGFRTV